MSSITCMIQSCHVTTRLAASWFRTQQPQAATHKTTMFSCKLFRNPFGKERREQLKGKPSHSWGCWQTLSQIIYEPELWKTLFNYNICPFAKDVQVPLEYLYIVNFSVSAYTANRLHVHIFYPCFGIKHVLQII